MTDLAVEEAERGAAEGGRPPSAAEMASAGSLILGGAAVTVAIVFVTLLPFLPGPYDPLAAPLSATARAFGFASLLLVPLAALAKVRRFPAIATGALSVVGGVTALAAFSFAGPLLAVVILAVWAFVTFRLKPHVRPAHFLIVPIAVFTLQRLLIGPAVDWSRARAIRNAALLIADIERYRVARGSYPLSLLSLWKDYKPSVIGVDRYQYEPAGGAYNLLFEQPAASLPTREIVVYNPHDRQTATSHAMDILEFPPERLELARGFFAAHTTPYPHWKYFWFD